ncbi:hypothetical protein F4556_005002 [Kitasatospora gansuensis]|uniref:Uncharacterized protein n=1 Tax=Kitasatospora gansuensis TaxID=258050 RepID=A0A7W7WJ44_9ACTN|nr:hypothetical protein [Kitasatospora gansuensis]MBB4949467.1 hypothetical protein [Kitasatospora gansuensis]
MTKIRIDPNVRVRGNLTYAGLDDVTGELKEHAEVEVYEPESGLAGHGHVEQIDLERGLVYVAVHWKTLSAPQAQRGPATPPLLSV